MDSVRVGIGYDIHPLKAGRALIIGGVNIESELGLDGHSDADVLCHAVADALLGAGALDDIGSHFPDSDPQFAGMSSLDILRRVAELLRDTTYQVVNVDATIVAEAPRIGPHRVEMQRNIADALGCPPQSVSVKASTNEGLGSLGKSEGIAAYAVALIEQR